MHSQTLLFSAWCCLAFPSIQLNAALITDFVDFSLVDQITGNTLLPGRMYVPPESSAGPRPMILFLHGGGGNLGTDNSSHVVGGNFDNLLAEAKRRGAFLYAPQTASNWANRMITDRVISMVNRSKFELPIQSDRVYVTGLSLGGGGTWNLLNRYGETFAAGIPICGVPPTNDFSAANLIDEPIWAFHAKNDPTVSVNVTRNNFSNILLAAGETPPAYTNDPVDSYFDSSTLELQYTEFATGGHAIWNRVYSTPSVYDWLFSQSSAVPEPNSFLQVTFISLALLRKLSRRRKLQMTSGWKERHFN